MNRGIAISGRAGAGKSTLAGMFVPYGYYRMAFADALKEEVYRDFGLVKTDLGGREKLLEVGETRRTEDPDYWIDRLAVKAEETVQDGNLVVVDDLRTSREAEWCRRFGLALVRIEAPPVQRAIRLAAQGMDPFFAWSDVVNETELEYNPPGWDFIIWNDGLGSLKPDVQNLCRVLRRRRFAEMKTGLTRL